MTKNVFQNWLANPMMDTRVVLIEDELLIALDLEESVSTCGVAASVIGFASQKEHALRIGALADIAFIDINLVDGPTGPEIGAILAEQHGVSVIFMTANPAMLGAGIPGALGCITKPVHPHAVQQALAYAMAKRAGTLAVVPDSMQVFSSDRV